MSRKNYLPIALGILPMLSFLMISPSEIGRKMGRLPATDLPPVAATVSERKADLAATIKPVDPASIKIEGEPVVKSNDRVEKIMADYRKEKPHTANNDLDKKSYLSQVDGLVDLVKDEKNTLKPSTLDESSMKDAKIRLEGIAQFLSQEIDDLKDMKARTLLSPEDLKLVQSKIDSSEVTLEDLLKALEDEAPRLAKVSAAKPEVKVEVKPEAKPEIKTEATIVADQDSKDKKDKPKKEQTDSEKLLCELQSQNKILNQNLQTQITNQQNIMMMMVTMMQSFISNQNAQLDLSRQQSLYQYNSPYAAPQANWMYQPFQAQNSLFGQPSNTNLYSGYGLQTQGSQQMQGQQFGQGASGSWGLKPDQGLQMMDPRYTPMTGLTPGQLGGSQQSLGNFGYDMSIQLPGMMTTPYNVPTTAPLLPNIQMT